MTRSAGRTLRLTNSKQRKWLYQGDQSVSNLLTVARSANDATCPNWPEQMSGSVSSLRQRGPEKAVVFRNFNILHHDGII